MWIRPLWSEANIGIVCTAISECPFVFTVRSLSTCDLVNGEPSEFGENIAKPGPDYRVHIPIPTDPAG